MSEKNNNSLSEEQIEHIAERAATKAIAKLETHLYTSVGKGVLNKLAYVLGVIVISFYFYLQSKGIIK